MLTNYKGEKITPNQAAKALICDQLERCFYDIEEKLEYGSNPTDNEIKEIIRHMNKHVNAIYKKLGVK